MAEVLNHVVFARRDHEAAAELLADTYEQLGYGAENGTWRSAYLSGAHQLRHGDFGTPAVSASPDMIAQLTPAELLDALAIRVNGPRCWREQVSLDVDLTDTAARHRLRLRNGALTHTAAAQTTPPDAVLHLTTAALPALLAGGPVLELLAAAGTWIEGDPSALIRLLDALDAPDPGFAIVRP